MKYVVLLLLAIAAVQIYGQDAKRGRFMCFYTQKPDTMFAWALDHPPANIPAIHYEDRNINQGSLLTCDGVANDNRPGCTLTYIHGQQLTMGRGDQQRSPSTDSVQLSCLGTGNLCCSIKITHAASTKKKDNPPSQ